MFVDTHAHLLMLDEISSVIERAKSADVKKIITVSTTLADSKKTVSLVKRYEGVWATFGIHPCDCKENWQEEMQEVEKLVEEHRDDIVGIGETGLDFYHKPFVKERQIEAFKAHIELAIKHDLPLAIHIRESAEAVLEVLEGYAGKVRGVAHCFSQDKAVAQKLLDWGFYLGIGGPLTYSKNDELRSLFQEVALERIILETDAPFLPPQAFRGKKNYPEYIPYIAQELARIREIKVDEVARVTTENVKALFRI